MNSLLQTNEHVLHGQTLRGRRPQGHPDQLQLCLSVASPKGAVGGHRKTQEHLCYLAVVFLVVLGQGEDGNSPLGSRGMMNSRAGLIVVPSMDETLHLIPSSIKRKEISKIK